MKRMNLQLFAEPTGGAGGTEPPAGRGRRPAEGRPGRAAAAEFSHDGCGLVTKKRRCRGAR